MAMNSERNLGGRGGSVLEGWGIVRPRGGFFVTPGFGEGLLNKGGVETESGTPARRASEGSPRWRVGLVWKLFLAEEIGMLLFPISPGPAPSIASRAIPPLALRAGPVPAGPVRRPPGLPLRSGSL